MSHEHNHSSNHHGHDSHHGHDEGDLDNQSPGQALGHLKADSMVLGGVGGAAVASEFAGFSALKTGLSLGGEDAWWVLMNARDGWSQTEGSWFQKARQAFNASKYSLGVLAVVSGFGAAAVEYSIENHSAPVAAAAFCTGAVAISSTAMVEDMRNDSLNDTQQSAAKLASRRFRQQGILATFALGAVFHRQIADGNPLVMAAIGGTDCLWTAVRNYRYVKKANSTA